ncbi:unnamed protein product [Mucor hiemalis]
MTQLMFKIFISEHNYLIIRTSHIYHNDDDSEEHVNNADTFNYFNAYAPMEEIVNNLGGLDDPRRAVAKMMDAVKDYPFEHGTSDPFQRVLDFMLIALFNCGALNVSDE